MGNDGATDMETSLEEKAGTSWHDIITLPFEKLKAVYDSHKAVIEAGDEKAIAGIASLHILDIKNTGKKERNDDPLDKEKILRYFKQLLGSGELAPEVYETINRNGSVGFQREIIKPTNKLRKDNGRLIESIKVYPDGTRIRLFHNTWNNDDDRKKAYRGQMFYYGLVKHIKENYGGYETIKNILDTLKPIEPLHSDKGMLDNIFLKGEDGEEAYKKLSLDERIAKTCQQK